MRNESIAIIGMGCIFPDANNPEEYWKNIISRHSAIRDLPKDLWDPALYYHPVRALYKTYSKIGASISGFEKNPLKFRIPPVSAPFIERSQFLMLEVVHQALEDAGYLKKKFPKDRTAVFVALGAWGNLAIGHHVRTYWRRFADSLKSNKEFAKLSRNLKHSILNKAEQIFMKDMPELSEDSCGGVFSSIVSSRINNCFNLGGTSLTVDAACSASLAAADIGIRSLRERRFDLVLVGGVDDRLDAGSYLFFSSLGALSAKGSFPFDERADGMVLGQGAGVILLKRLDEAVRDGDKVYAVIRNIETSTDGRAKSITAPDVNGQIRALERTYENLPFSLDSVSLVEAHGTGTWTGDITEITALTQFVRRYSDKKKFIGLGSVKSMIGHLKAAAGMAGIIKTALALHHKILPPTLNCEQPRKDVDWENSPFYLLTEPRPWKNGILPRRAAIDSFGFGGVNFHSVLEEAPNLPDIHLVDISNDNKEKIDFPAEIFIFRAATKQGLRKHLGNTKDVLIRTRKDDLREAAAHLRQTVPSAGPTLTIVAKNIDEVISHLNKALKILGDESRSEFSAAQGIYFSEIPLKTNEKIAFLFPGFGSQYLNMGGDLPISFPFVNGIFRNVDAIAQHHIEKSMLEVLISGEALSPKEKSRLNNLLMRPDYNHAAMIALGMGILEVLTRVGVRPHMVAGHSLGEYLALYAAGVFDRETSVDVIVARGKGIAKHCLENGAMASIGLPVDKLQGILKEAPGFVAVANKNCPVQTAISGDVRAIEYIMMRMEKENIPCTRLPVTFASHTSLLSSCVEPFREFLNNIKINPPRIPIQSNLTGRAYKIDGHFTSYLHDTLPKHLIQPVEFINNVLSLYEDGARLFVEVGPGSTLSSFVDNILEDRPHWTVVTNLARRSATLQLLHALAFCIAKGLSVDLNEIMPSRRQEHLHTAMHATTAQSKSSDMPQLTREALADEDAGIVNDYLEKRSTFLKDMIRADFKRFAETLLPPDDLHDRIIALISKKTGYPADVIDIDLNVESDLGLDSIKQVEIMRDVSRELEIDFGEDPRSQRFKITTARKLIELSRSLVTKKCAANQNERPAQETKGQIPIQNCRTDCHRWVSTKVEAPLSEKGNPKMLKGKYALLLADDAIGGLLKDLLEKAGAHVCVILPSDIPENLPKDFDLVLNLWAYAENEAPHLEKIYGWWEQTTQRAEAILKIAKKLLNFIQGNKNNRPLWVEVTSLGGELGAHDIANISARAGIGLGILRCLACEFPDTLESLYLDFDSQEPQRQVAKYIFDELIHQRKHREIGYTQGKRFEIRWKIDKLSYQERKLALNSNSVVLAIGGARGITASICRELARRSQAQFIVVGRTPFALDNDAKPDKPITFDQARHMLLKQAHAQGKRIIPTELDRLAWKQVWKTERSWNMNYLRDIAGKVTYHQCDITDAESMHQLIHEIKQEHSRIDLVIQGASDSIKKSTEDITNEEFIENMKSKALGTACLLAALADIEVDTFINFSSVAGRWGNMGQGSYAAGHGVADILVAGVRKKRPGKWINIFFGPWLNVGVIRIGAIVERLRAKGSDFVTGEAGNEFFIREFLNGASHNVAFCGKGSVRQIGPSFSQRQKEIKHLLAYRGDLVLAQVDIPFIKGVLELDEEGLLQEELTAKEIKQYLHLTHPKRRLEWLAGRIAAKSAIRTYLDGRAPSAYSIEIKNSPNRFPYAVTDPTKGALPLPYISISHSGDMAVAVASEDAGIGVDTEAIAEHIVEIADEFCMDQELKRISQCSRFDRTTVLTSIWAMKEASRKVIGAETCSMKDIILEKAEMHGDYIVSSLSYSDSHHIRSITFQWDKYIFGISAYESCNDR